MGKLSTGIVKFYNDGVVQAVTFAYLIYRWYSCLMWWSNTEYGSRITFHNVSTAD